MSLSKTKFTKALQCQKLLYLEMRHPELLPKVSASQQAIFDQGHVVGELAQKEFPGGVNITASHKNPEQAIRDTQAAIGSGALTLYEAAFKFDDVLIRADIIHRESLTSLWDLIEVKSSSELKEQHLPDVAIQTWVLRKSGLKLGQQYLMHLNKKCVFPDLTNLFTKKNVTLEVLELLPKIPTQLKSIKKTLAGKNPPKIDIGPHCDTPYECPFKAVCWKNIPTPSVFDIPKLAGTKKWELYHKNKIELIDIPKKDLKPMQIRMIESSLHHELFIDSKKIAAELSEWNYPLSFLDFETVGPAVPRYEGKSPYAQVPFQFSLHVIESPGATPKHSEYLHDDSTDPRPRVTRALEEHVPQTGSIVSYHAGVERGILIKLGLDAMAERIVDLLPVVRNHVYHPDFLGSFSIKSVAPALIGDSINYDHLEVADGNAAQSAFEKLISPTISSEEKRALKRSMLEYCKQDTWAMVKVFEWLTTH